MKKKFFFTFVFLFFAFGGFANATVLTFETLATSPNGGIPISTPFTEQGFSITWDALSNSLSAFGDGWQAGWFGHGSEGRGSSNGTTVVGAYSYNSLTTSFDLSATSGGLFSIVSIDVAEVFNSNDFAFAAAAESISFTGYKSDGTQIYDSFNLDGVSDGIGGLSDFQMYTFGSAWTGLTRINIAGINNAAWIDQQGNEYVISYFAFDNIALNAAAAPVPEPATMLLLGLGLMGLAGARRFKI